MKKRDKLIPKKLQKKELQKSYKKENLQKNTYKTTKKQLKKQKRLNQINPNKILHKMFFTRVVTFFISMLLGREIELRMTISPLADFLVVVVDLHWW